MKSRKEAKKSWWQIWLPTQLMQVQAVLQTPLYTSKGKKNQCLRNYIYVVKLHVWEMETESVAELKLRQN